MIVRKISEEEYRKWLPAFNYSPFQSYEYYRRFKLHNQPAALLAAFEEGSDTPYIMMMGGFYKYMRIFRYFYSPFGFLSRDILSADEIEEFIRKSAELLSGEHTTTIKFDTMMEMQQLDAWGNPVENGYNRSDLKKELEKRGFLFNAPMMGAPETGTPRQVSILDLADLSGYEGVIDTAPKEITGTLNIEQCRKLMDSKARQHIKVAERPYIQVEEGDTSRLKRMYDLSADHNNYESLPEDVLKDYKEAFQENCRIKVAILDVPEYLKFAKAHLEELQSRIQPIKEYVEANPNAKKKARQLAALEVQLPAAEKLLEDAQRLEKEGYDRVDLAAAMFLYSPTQIFYFTSGIDRAWSSYQGNYAIQWDTICEAAEKKVLQYNLLGIGGDYSKDDPYYPLISFKRSLGARIAEYTGPIYYPLQKQMTKIMMKKIPE